MQKFISAKGTNPKAGPGFRSPVVQARLTVNQPGDRYEREADAVADRVVSMRAAAPLPASGSLIAPSLQRKCSACEESDKHNKPLLRKAQAGAGTTVSPGLVSQLAASQAGGTPLAGSTRSFMERAFSSDFAGVRVHQDATAAAMSRQIGARAFTHGSHIYFNQGQYQPHTSQGAHLLAHELTHTLQQGSGLATPTVQRDCDDPTFCTPYATPAEAAAAEAGLRSNYLPAEGAYFGADSRRLYESYLSRRPGDSLAPVIFNNPANEVVVSFADSWATADDQDAVIDLVGSRLSRAPGGPLRDYTPTTMSLANFLSPAEMNIRPINYRNPLSIAGHIAGGMGSSAAGADYRKITYGNVTLERIPIAGPIGYVRVETTLQYEVFDAIDFCPGDCGSIAEKRITIPMSRLEASGEAYDVPFKVNFIPESRSKRFFYS